MDPPRKILVIDDNRLVLEGLAAWLERQAYQVISAEGGLKGLELARSNLPDVIICDYSMPDLNGLEVLEALKSSLETAEVPFILYSGHWSPSLKSECNRLGADACVDKSDGIDTLLEAVREVLADKRSSSRVG